MKLRTSAATALAAAAAVLGMGAAPAMAATPAVAKPTALSIKASSGTVTYNSWVKLTAHLGATHSNRTVEIDRTTAGATSVVASGHVDRYGNLTAWAKMPANTWFHAKFTGDANDLQANAWARVYSADKITSGMVNYYTISAGYHLYHFTSVTGYNKAKPVIEGWVSPNKAGENITSYWQVYWNGAWRNINSTNPQFALYKDSSFGIYFDDIIKLGLPQRTAVYVGGDAQNSAAFSGWQYFKVTK